MTDSTILYDRTSRSRVTVGGPDRAKFLHNLTTQDIKRLPVGEGREAFVTNPQGKTLGFLDVLATEDRLLLRTEPESLSVVLPHLQKYGIFDEVSIDDVSDSTFEFHIAGNLASIVAALALPILPEGDLRHATARIAGADVRMVRESPTGRPGLSLIGPRESAEVVRSAWLGAGAVAGDFEPARIEGGYPASGRDVTPENLPQEVARDARAISFIKGCYLGQETVARIDALGHVNKLLRGLVVEGTDLAVAPGATLQADGKPVGAVTSSVWSEWLGRVLALGYVRTAQAGAGTRLAVIDRERTFQAVVSDLPFPTN